MSSVFFTLDRDRSGLVSDSEYSSFYDEFIVPFEACDPDNNGKITVAELTTCLTYKDATSKFKALALIKDQSKDIPPLLDRKDDITLFDYIFLRRIENAVRKCGDSGTVQPHKIYCALSITTPRTQHVKSSEERLIFEAGVILTDGFYYGQTSYLNIKQFIAVAQIFNYFEAYELPYSDGIVEPQDFIRAVQEANLPEIYNPLVIDKLFIDMDGLDFVSLCATVWAYRAYQTQGTAAATDFTASSGSLGRIITLSQPRFTEILTSFPARVRNVIDNSGVPDQATIETASAAYWGTPRNRENTFLGNFNNLIFL